MKRINQEKKRQSEDVVKKETRKEVVDSSACSYKDPRNCLKASRKELEVPDQVNKRQRSMSLSSAGSQLGFGLNLQSTPRAEDIGISDLDEYYPAQPGSLAAGSAAKLQHLSAIPKPAAKPNKRPKTGQHRASRLDQRLGGMDYTKDSLKAGRN